MKEKNTFFFSLTQTKSTTLIFLTQTKDMTQFLPDPEKKKENYCLDQTKMRLGIFELHS